MDEDVSTMFDEVEPWGKADGSSDLIDSPGSLPEHRPLRETVVRTLAAPEAPPAPIVVGRAVSTTTKKSSDLSADSLVAVAVIAAIVAALSFVRPSFITAFDQESPAAPVELASPVTPAAPSSLGLPQGGPSRVDWGDGYHHLVVTTAVRSNVDLMPASAPAARPQAPPGSGSTQLERADGTVIDVEVPAESLELAVPTRNEAPALITLGAESLTRPIVVIDVNGVVGEPMARYIQVDGRLVEPPDPTPDPPPTSVDEVPQEEVVESLLALPDVVDVTPLAPGLLAVAARAPIDDLAEHPGVISVGDDVLLGLATLAGPPQSTQPTTPWPTPLPPQVSGPRPVVAVIDTGFAEHSSELAGAWWSNDDVCGNGVDDDANGYVDDCRGWDFGANDSDPAPEESDTYGDHGTEVASVIAGARNGSGVIGVSPGARIMPLKVTRPTGAIAMSSVAAAVDYAVANGADVVNLSLVTQPGVSRDDVVVLEAAIDRAADAGVVVVAGAGNDGRNLLLTPAWPASLGAERHHVLTVGALDSDGSPTAFSNQGRAVTFAAAGTAIPVAGCDAGTAWRSGTSYSAAIVSGLVANVLAEQAPSDLEALLAGVVERTQLVDGVYVVAGGPVVDSPSAAPGGKAPTDPTCRPTER